MNKRISAIIIFVIGFGVFLAAIYVISPMPRLRPIEEPAINATYNAPFSFSPVDMRERKVTGKAHVRRSVPNTVSDYNSAQDFVAGEDPMIGLGLGQFSTQAARDYHAIPYHSHVPNVQYVKGECRNCK